MTIVRLSLKNAIENRSRFGLTVAAVILSVAFLTATLILSDSISGTAEADVAQANANVSFVVEGATVLEGESGPGEIPEAVTLTLPAAAADAVISAQGVESAAPVISGFAKLVENGEIVGTSTAADVGRNWITDEALNPFTLVEGTAPTASEVVIDQKIAAEGAIRVGDTVQVLTVTGVHELTVSGLASFGGGESAALQRTVLFENDRAAELMNEEGFTSIRVRSAGDNAAAMAAVASSLPDAVVIDGPSYILDQQENIASPFSFLSLFLIAFAGIATVAGATIIFNTFAIAIGQRRRELALLRAVGAKRREVLQSVLGESIFIAVFATAVGIGVGIVGAGAMRSAMSTLGLSFIDGPTVVTFPTIAIATLVGLTVTVGSAWGPARAAASAAPVEALREAAAEARATSRLRTTSGLVLLVAGIGGLFAAAYSSSTLLLTVAALLVPGLILAGPALMSSIARIAQPTFGRVAGIEGTMATSNLERNPRRAASTSLGLTLGVAMIAFFTILASSLSASLSGSLAENLQANAVVGSATDEVATIDPLLADRLSGLEGVRSIAPLTVGEGTADELEATVAGITPAMSELFDFNVISGSLDGLADGGVAVWTGGDAVDPQVGDIVDFEFADGSITVPVVAVFDESLSGFDAPTHLVSQQTLTGVLDELLTTSIFVGTDGQASTLVAVQETVSETPGSLFYTKDSFVDASGSAVDSIRNLIYAMLGMTVFISLVGVANTTALAVSERTREIGLLRAVGTTRRGVRKMIRYEAALMSAIGTAVGISLAVFGSWAFIGSQGGSEIAGVTIPWLSVAAIVVTALAAGVLAAAMPAWRASRLATLDAIAS